MQEGMNGLERYYHYRTDSGCCVLVFQESWRHLRDFTEVAGSAAGEKTGGKRYKLGCSKSLAHILHPTSHIPINNEVFTKCI